MNGPCCAGAGACSRLRSALAATDAEDDNNLCNVGKNLCDANGNLVQLTLQNEVRCAWLRTR